MMYNTVFTFHLSLGDPRNTTTIITHNCTSSARGPRASRTRCGDVTRAHRTRLDSVHTHAHTSRYIHSSSDLHSDPPRRPTHSSVDRVRVRVPLLKYMLCVSKLITKQEGVKYTVFHCIHFLPCIPAEYTYSFFISSDFQSSVSLARAVRSFDRLCDIYLFTPAVPEPAPGPGTAHRSNV